MVLLSRQVSRYSLSVQAFDSGSPAMSSTVILNIDVSDVNDNPPVFTPPNSTAILQVAATLFARLLGRNVFALRLSLTAWGCVHTFSSTRPPARRC